MFQFGLDSESINNSAEARDGVIRDGLSGWRGHSTFSTSLLGIAGVVGYLLHGAPELWPVLWIGLGLGLLLGITTYLGAEWIPAVIRLNDKGVERQVLRGIHIHLERWKWTDIAHCCFERTEAAGRDFEILAVYSATGQVVPLGLNRKVSREKLQECSKSKTILSQQLRALSLPLLPITSATPSCRAWRRRRAWADSGIASTNL